MKTEDAPFDSITSGMLGCICPVCYSRDATFVVRLFKNTLPRSISMRCSACDFEDEQTIDVNAYNDLNLFDVFKESAAAYRPYHITRILMTERGVSSDEEH